MSSMTVKRVAPEYAILDIARAQIPQTLMASKVELEQLKQDLHMHRGKPIEEELSYEEFYAALAPYCKPAGRFPERDSTRVVLERIEWRTVLALDLSTIDKPVPTAVRKVQCPTCYSLVDAGPRCSVCSSLLDAT